MKADRILRPIVRVCMVGTIAVFGGLSLLVLFSLGVTVLSNVVAWIGSLAECAR